MVDERFEVDPDRPLMLQVSRFDRFKDPLGVIAAYRLARTFMPGLQLVLAGGGAMIPGIDEVVAHLTGTPTMLVNPFANMAISSRIRPQALTADASSLFVACGLAMRRFDSQ